MIKSPNTKNEYIAYSYNMIFRKYMRSTFLECIANPDINRFKTEAQICETNPLTLEQKV